MNLSINKYTLLALAMTLTVFSSCKKDEEDVEETFTPYAGSTHIVGIRAQGSGEETADYLLRADNINSGELTSVGQGEEQLGWCYYSGLSNNMLFSFSYDVNKAVAYSVNSEGNLQERGSFVFERVDCFAEADNNTLVAIGAPWGGGSLDNEIMLIDKNEVGIKKRKTTRFYTIPGPTEDLLNKWPTSTVVRDGKLYVSFYPVEGASWDTPITDTAYVSIYSYPGLQYEKTIKDTRTGPIGYYGSSPSMIVDEDDNIYTFSPVSLAAGYTETETNSAILRIKDGEEEFDASYYFDFETVSGGKKVLTAAYAGNGLAVARVVKDDDIQDVWAAFSLENEICEMVVIDLVNKTVTPVAGIPDHGGQYCTPFLVKDGYVYVSISTPSLSEAFVYKINPTTASGVKAAEIIGQEASVFFKVN